MQNNWKIFFIFSKKERKGIAIIGGILLLNVLLKFWFPMEPKLAVNKSTIKKVLIDFDPNTLDSAMAYQIGFSPKQFTILQNYRNKGGRFYKAGDIKKLYGLSHAYADSLLPFVKIPSTTINSNTKIYAKKTIFKSSLTKKNYQYMRYEDWEALGIFNKKQIRLIYQMKYQNKGKLSWRELVLAFDLTKEEATILKNKTNITD